MGEVSLRKFGKCLLFLTMMVVEGQEISGEKLLGLEINESSCKRANDQWVKLYQKHSTDIFIISPSSSTLHVKYSDGTYSLFLKKNSQIFFIPGVAPIDWIWIEQPFPAKVCEREFRRGTSSIYLRNYVEMPEIRNQLRKPIFESFLKASINKVSAPLS